MVVETKGMRILFQGEYMENLKQVGSRTKTKLKM